MVEFAMVVAVTAVLCLGWGWVLANRGMWVTLQTPTGPTSQPSPTVIAPVICAVALAWGFILAARLS